MRLRNGLLVAGFVSLVLAGCQTAEAPDDSGLKSRVDSSIIEAAAASEARGDYASAAGYYRSVYERDPENVKVAVGLSRNLRYVERPREAEAIMERALRKAPKEPALLAERGKVHRANLEAPAAVEVLSLAAQAKPDDWDVQTALAVGFDRLSLYDQAERHYQRAMTLAPDSAVVLNNYGLSLAQRGNLPKAIEVLRRAASQPDATAKTRQNLAMLYALSGDLIRTEELVRRDLPRELADRNMAHYRQIAANRRFADVAAVTREAAERSGLGATAIEATPLAPLPGAPAGTPRQPDPPKPAPATAAAGREAPKPDDAAATDDEKPKEMAAKPAPAKQAEKLAPPKAVESKPGAPTPLTSTPTDKAERPAAQKALPSTMADKAKSAPPKMADAATAKPTDADNTPPPKPNAAKTGAGKAEAMAVAKAEPPKRTARAGTPYKLQLASFRREAQAMAARKLLLAQHKEVLGDLDLEVMRINLGKRGDFYRVLSAALDSRAAAADLCRQLKTRNADCLLIRADKP